MKIVGLYTRGKSWIEGKPHNEQGLVPHRDYLVEHFGDNIIAIGPFMNHTGGLFIFEAESIETIEDIIYNDPAILEEKFEVTLYPWEPLIGIFNQ